MLTNIQKKSINVLHMAITSDGYFLPVLKYLRGKGKEVIILSRRARTAREIRRFAGDKFCDFEYLKFRLKMNDPNQYIKK